MTCAELCEKSKYSAEREPRAAARAAGRRGGGDCGMGAEAEITAPDGRAIARPNEAHQPGY
jgi:hypothetical protein